LFGGWSEFVYLEPGVGIARLPDTISFESYIGGGCGLLTAVHILERAALRPGDTVLVQGTGAVGLSAIALARLGGASTVFAIGAPRERLDLAERMGADVTFDLDATTAPERLELLRARTHGEGVDVVIEAAGSARAIEEGVVLVRDGGRYVIAGHYTDVGSSTLNAHRDINRKHLEIRGCWGSEVGHFLRAISLLERHAARVPWHEIGGRRYGLQSLNEALEDAAAMRITKALVDPWESKLSANSSQLRADGQLTADS
jgi:L-iditol 2-dehydrogenase